MRLRALSVCCVLKKLPRPIFVVPAPIATAVLKARSLPVDHICAGPRGNAALKRVLQQAEMVAPMDATVLILGETGTGKELIARATHRLCPRKNLPSFTLNCAAIPTGLLESELLFFPEGAAFAHHQP